ncbi:MAG: 4-(cytidine 5'-diphospho)-2-C-methyl-D-erythritol kinase [Bacteroidales bacterium]|nr:4-(cytidine 5'-diphospho)-2-C-methyl-D-erythritol kinase [Bacteroidales bacterium]
MICFPNAKINIGLRILEKMPDGYHHIETVFCPVGLTDVLEFLEDSSLNNGTCMLKTTGLSVSVPSEKNLVAKAYDLMNRKKSLPGIRVHLHKIIPMGAGLGGGSSDAAFMLKSLNEVYQLGLSREEMANIAAKIGSDCPFFLRNAPVFASGKGERFREINAGLGGLYLVMVLPGIHVSTVEAYASVRPKKPEKSLYDLIKLPLHSWKENIINDFEMTIFNKHPELGKIKEELYKLGAVYASMSGSGSAVYGLFSDPPQSMGHIEKYLCWKGKLE